MGALRTVGKLFWRFMVIFSFIVNVVLVVVLLVLGILIFEIKHNVAEPLVGGLHGSFVGLDQATIDWTIPVRDTLPISLSVPINAGTITSQVAPTDGGPVIPGETLVRLTRNVPISINNAFIQSNDLTLRNARVDITLPAGTVLPVALDMEVGLETDIPVSLDVRAVIPLAETQLHDPFENLRLLFEPFTRALYHLPDGFDEVGPFVGDVLAGEIDLLEAVPEEEYDPWLGYSRTAGLGYTLAGEPWPLLNVPVPTGLIPPGGIPPLDEQIRPEVYDAGGPEDVNEQAMAAMRARGVPRQLYDGRTLIFLLTGDTAPQGADAGGDDDPPEDLGIIPPGAGDGGG